MTIEAGHKWLAFIGMILFWFYFSGLSNRIKKKKISHWSQSRSALIEEISLHFVDIMDLLKLSDWIVNKIQFRDIKDNESIINEPAFIHQIVFRKSGS